MSTSDVNQIVKAIESLKTGNGSLIATIFLAIFGYLITIWVANRNLKRNEEKNIVDTIVANRPIFTIRDVCGTGMTLTMYTPSKMPVTHVKVFLAIFEAKDNAELDNAVRITDKGIFDNYKVRAYTLKNSINKKFGGNLINGDTIQFREDVPSEIFEEIKGKSNFRVYILSQTVSNEWIYFVDGFGVQSEYVYKKSEHLNKNGRKLANKTSGLYKYQKDVTMYKEAEFLDEKLADKGYVKLESKTTSK